MKPVKHMTDAELKYAASDLRSAIAVTEPSHYSNMDRYLADYRAVIGEQESRDRKRILRQTMAIMPCDLMSVRYPMDEPRIRYYHTARAVNTGQAYRRDKGLSAMFTLYWRAQ